jgi:non-canonical purine NTP pyrophosphatase (RdgB/HAM1 family)
MRLLVASKNRSKIKEIKEIYKGSIEILSPIDIAVRLDILEDGRSLRENSLKKALAYFRETDICTIGEDTGLFVDALKGSPGVYSARYGRGGDESNRKKLLSELKGKKNRNAYFETVISLVVSEGFFKFFEGIVRGKITEEEIGRGGFGYDPVFLPEGYKKTFGQMSADEKNSISHRRMALVKVFDYIERNKAKITRFCK